MLILSGHRAYSWGENDSGSLGTNFRKKIDDE